jgi:hypothetical protein
MGTFMSYIQSIYTATCYTAGWSDSLMSTHKSVLVDSVGPPSAEVCRAAASFP